MIIWDIFVILILIALNGYFVGVEFAIVTSRRTRIDSLAEDGHRGANIVQGWLSNPATRDRVIAAAQLGITIVSLALGAVGENTFEELLAPYFHDMILPENLQFLGFGYRGFAADYFIDRSYDIACCSWRAGSQDHSPELSGTLLDNHCIVHEYIYEGF